MDKTQANDITVEKGSDVRLGRHQLVPYLVATASVSALVVVCVLGSLYIHELKGHAGTSTTVQQSKFDSELEDKSGTVKEHIEVDEDRRVEFIVQTNSTGHLINVVTVDFEKGVLGLYSEPKDACYVVIGTSTFLPTWETVREAHKRGTTSDAQLIRLAKVSETELGDRNVLPMELVSYCQHKPLYWAKFYTGTETRIEKRQRRGVEIYVKAKVFGVEVEVTIRL